MKKTIGPKGLVRQVEKDIKRKIDKCILEHWRLCSEEIDNMRIMGMQKYLRSWIKGIK